MMKEYIAEREKHGKWDDAWATHPLPTINEPEEAMCWLTPRADLDGDRKADDPTQKNRMTCTCSVRVVPIMSARAGESKGLADVIEPTRASPIAPPCQAIYVVAGWPLARRDSKSRSTYHLHDHSGNRPKLTRCQHKALTSWLPEQKSCSWTWWLAWLRCLVVLGAAAEPRSALGKFDQSISAAEAPRLDGSQHTCFLPLLCVVRDVYCGRA